jgi:protein-disulfide isomerase-like protein with CxxC motif
MREKAVRHADADALLPAQDRPHVDRRTGLDQRIARITGEEFGALTLDDRGNDVGAVHELSPRDRSRSASTSKRFIPAMIA